MELGGNQMKRLFTFVLLAVFLTNTSGLTFAAPLVLGSASANSQKPVYNKNARTISYAFVFDGPSEKNAVVMKQFEKAITLTTAPDYKASFSPSNVYVGNWSNKGAKEASDKALNSNATMVISLGYLSTAYINSKHDKNKFVVTLDQYGLRDLGSDFFNPVQQSVKGALLFKRLINFKKAAVLMNESFYKTRSDWDSYLKPKLNGMDFAVFPVSPENIDATVAKVSGSYDAVIVTPLFNLPCEKRKELFAKLNEKKIPTFSTLGREDVVDGVLLGAGAYDLDRKIAEATSFNIKGVLNGDKSKPKKIEFYEDQIVYINQDTADLIGYDPHLRVLNNAEVISNKKPKLYSLSAIFSELDKQNLDIERKKLLVKAARRSSTAAMLRYLPTLAVTLGYQSYNQDYAESVSLLVPEKTGVFQIGLEQVLYSPALVTNILVKKKMVNFQKEEQRLTEQNMGIDIALLYVETLMLENKINDQKEYVKEARENLAIARVREKMGKCGKEEAFRWATQLYVSEQQLLDMTAALKNIKLNVNKMLFNNQTQNFDLAALKATDPAFFTSDIHIIDYVITPKYLEQFTQMLVAEAFRVSPELSKLKAAIKMKDYEMAMYYQKFFLPDAKLNLTYTSLMGREFAKPLPYAPLSYNPTGLVPGGGGMNQAQFLSTAAGAGHWTNMSALRPDATNLQLGIFAQWKPIEGGTKIAEIARIKAEKDELLRYQDEAKTSIEEQVRATINRALAGYFSIEKNYKAMYMAHENYEAVKDLYLKGTIPITHLLDAQEVYFDSKTKALNSQYTFFKELVWVQRAICATDWSKANPEAKQFIQNVKDHLEKRSDIEYL